MENFRQDCKWGKGVGLKTVPHHGECIGIHSLRVREGRHKLGKAMVEPSRKEIDGHLWKVGQQTVEDRLLESPFCGQDLVRTGL